MYAVVAAVIMIGAVAQGSPRTARQSEIPAEEYAVYSAVIAEMFAGGKVTFDTGSKVKILVIKDHTVRDPFRGDVEIRDWKDLKEQFSSITQETIDDYAAKRKEAYQLQDAFDPKLKHTLFKKAEFEEMFKDIMGGWEAFYKRFPDSGGFVGFSRVGFDPAMNQALVYVEHGCGSLCGTGHYVLLDKGEGGWKIAKRFMAWIS